MTKSRKLMAQLHPDATIFKFSGDWFFGVFFFFFFFVLFVLLFPGKIYWNLNENAMMHPSRVLLMKSFTLNCLVEQGCVVNMLYGIAKMDQIALAFMRDDGKKYNNK